MAKPSPLPSAPPALKPSGASFADLQRGGLAHVVALILDANGVGEPVAGLARVAAAAPGAARNAAGVIDNFTSGAPVPHGDALAALDGCVLALQAVALAAVEIRALIAATPGTLTTESGRPNGVPDRPVRRF